MRNVLILLALPVVLASCGRNGANQASNAAGAEEAVEQAASSTCDTAFVFNESLPSEIVLQALEEARLVPKEVRLGTAGASDGTTGGGVADSTSLEQIESGIEAMREQTGVDPTVIGIRVGGVIETESLGEIADDVHTRTVVPAGASVAMSEPGVGGEPVEFGGMEPSDC